MLTLKAHGETGNYSMTQGAYSERQDILREILAPIDPARFTTDEIIQTCSEWLPGCTVDEIIEALRACAQQHLNHATRLLQQTNEGGARGTPGDRE